ncbi:unnamed protein product [Brassicogethes aeneus]|uniref:RING-type domain-containing protein n=1 Tax=Brassicogethes aeneus TaxID=1431903 RepID=A0A9P0BBC1_BRAAE|nr:unnamed protein product [Brassicogethes aeneus]
MHYHPLVLGAMLVVAVGTAIYTIWSNSGNQQQNTYQHHSGRDFNDDEFSLPYHLSLEDGEDQGTRRRRKNKNCSICLDFLARDFKNLPCGHVFHTRCIESWFRNKRNCPVCRSEAL